MNWLLKSSISPEGGIWNLQIPWLNFSLLVHRKLVVFFCARFILGHSVLFCVILSIKSSFGVLQLSGIILYSWYVFDSEKETKLFFLYFSGSKAAADRRKGISIRLYFFDRYNVQNGHNWTPVGSSFKERNWKLFYFRQTDFWIVRNCTATANRGKL